MKVRLCVPICASTESEIAEWVRRIEKHGEVGFVEIRLDYLKQPDKANMKTIFDTSLKTIATCRPSWEFGRFSGSEKIRKAILQKASKHADFTDVEMNACWDSHEFSSDVIISTHLKNTPNIGDLKRLFLKQRRMANICKIIATAKSLRDNARILKFVSMASQEAKVISFAMGEKGVVSRILAPIFGSYLTFAAISGRESAPGQLTVEGMVKIYADMGVELCLGRE
ncbi:MAG: type I 3-dehydroquinate dehydratase [Candidatus Micrarchaeia archaeon]